MALVWETIKSEVVFVVVVRMEIFNLYAKRVIRKAKS